MIDPRAVESNNYGAVHVDDWNAHLAGFFYSSPSIINVVVDIFVGVLNTKVIKVTHSRVAERAPFRAVDNNLRVHRYILSCEAVHETKIVVFLAQICIACPTPVCYSNREMKQAADHTTTKSRIGSSSTKRASNPAHVPNPKQAFAITALNMSWQLAIVVLVPVLVGVKLDKVFGTSYIFTFIGLALALAGSGLVMWRAMQAANRLPVPKLTEKQKRAIRKSYEEEDDD